VAAFALVLVALVCYLIVRGTAIFAVTAIEVDGAPPAVALQVKHTLRAQIGTSLLRVDAERVREEVARVPTVASASLDRAFPHTLRISVVPELPVAVVRQGGDSWLVSARGRVMAALHRGARRGLPRIWIPRGAALAVGGHVPASLDRSIAAVEPLRTTTLRSRVTTVRADADELTLVLRSGREIRLGDTVDVPLKLAVAAKVLPRVSSDTRYVDVSVPERPVAGTIVATSGTEAQTDTSAATPPDTTLNSQLEVDGGGSIGP
jgi:cell division protein FtsQ